MRHTKISVPALLTDESTLGLELEAVADEDVDEPVHSSGLVEPRNPG